MSEAGVALTRQDVAGYVGGAFATLGIVTRDDLLRVLSENGAPCELVGLVGARVPVGTRFPDMRALWMFLGDLPVG